MGDDFERLDETGGATANGERGTTVHPLDELGKSFLQAQAVFGIHRDAMCTLMKSGLNQEDLRFLSIDGGAFEVASHVWGQLVELGGRLRLGSRRN